MIIYHQKVIFPHKSVPYSPEQIIQPHLLNIFTLKHDLRTFVEKMSRVALRTGMGRIAQVAWIRKFRQCLYFGNLDQQPIPYVVMQPTFCQKDPVLRGVVKYISFLIEETFTTAKLFTTRRSILG